MSSAKPENTRPLAGLPVGTHVKITAMNLADDTLQRLLEMGLIVGTECQIERYAPFDDPIEIKIRGYHLSLHASEAANIQVEVL